MIIVSAILLLIYGAIIFTFQKGLSRAESKTGATTLPDTSPTLLVCCKNEEASLPNLLETIRTQSYKNFKVLFVDDNSSDETVQLLERFAKTHPHVQVIHNPGKGKKSALEYGMSFISTDFVIVTDADCMLPPLHIQRLTSTYQQQSPDMILAPVTLYADINNLFINGQKLEFNALMASTAGAAAIGKPIMCNGANLAFSKKAWELYHNNEHHKYSSGDDQFLMLNIKKHKGKIVFLLDQDVIVKTKAASSWKEFMNQRKRWASKAPGYRDADLIFTALSVLLINCWMVTLMVLSCFSWPAFLMLITNLLLKTAIDYTLLSPYLATIGENRLVQFIPLIQIFYPFYIVGAAFGGLAGGFTWKTTKLSR